MKDKYCMIALVWNMQNKQIYTESRSEITKYWGEGEKGISA